MSIVHDFDKWLKRSVAQASPLERNMCYAAYMAGRRAHAAERARQVKAAGRRARREQHTRTLDKP